MELIGIDRSDGVNWVKLIPINPIYANFNSNFQLIPHLIYNFRYFNWDLIGLPPPYIADI